MPSKTSSTVKKGKVNQQAIVKSRIQIYIDQIRRENSSIDNQLAIISDQIELREEYLSALVNSFEDFLKEYEKDHPRRSEWHKSIKTAKKFLLNRK